jgi:uncharacterized membrane protein
MQRIQHAAVAVCLLAIPAFGGDAYAIRDLGNFGGQSAFAMAINSSGDVLVLASGFPDGKMRTFVVDKKRVEALPPGFEGADINARGEVVGMLREGGMLKPVLWEKKGGFMPLAPLLFADALNNRGQVAGAGPGRNSTHAYIRDREGGALDLGSIDPLYDLSPAHALAINELGQATGVTYIGGYLPGVFLWDGATLRRIHSKPGDAIQLGVARGTGINDRGEIVGYTGLGGCWGESFHYFEGVVTKLPLGEHAFAHGINEAGQIAGAMDVCGGNARGFLFDDGAVVELRGIGGAAAGARALNNRGDVAGYSRAPDGSTHAVVWEKR